MITVLINMVVTMTSLDHAYMELNLITNYVLMISVILQWVNFASLSHSVFKSFVWRALPHPDATSLLFLLFLSTTRKGTLGWGPTPG